MVGWGGPVGAKKRYPSGNVPDALLFPPSPLARTEEPRALHIRHFPIIRKRECYTYMAHSTQGRGRAGKYRNLTPGSQRATRKGGILHILR